VTAAAVSAATAALAAAAEGTPAVAAPNAL
jgi:hypothetical protein